MAIACKTVSRSNQLLFNLAKKNRIYVATNYIKTSLITRLKLNPNSVGIQSNNKSLKQKQNLINNFQERNKPRELPEKPKQPKAEPETKKPAEEKKEEEALRWGPRLYNYTQNSTMHDLREIWEPTPFRIRR